MAIVLPNGKQSFENATGGPAVGWKLYTYIAGTTTPKDTYTTSVGNVANTNPVVMNARGEAAIYWSGSYDVILKDNNDAIIWGPERLEETGSADDLEARLADTTSASNGDALVGVGSITSIAAGVRARHASLAAAASAIGSSTKADLIVRGTIAITGNTTLTSNITVKLVDDCLITVSGGVTLTVRGVLHAPLHQVFTGSGAVIGMRRVDPEWFGAVGDGTTNDISALDAAHACVAASLTSIGRKPTINLNALYAVGRMWQALPTTDIPLRIRGRGQPTASGIVALNTFTPANPVLHVSGGTVAAQINTDFELRDFVVRPSGAGYGAATAGILIGGTALPVGQVVNMSGYHNNIVADVLVLNFPKGLWLRHVRQIRFERVGLWNDALAIASACLYIDQAGGFTGDMNFSGIQCVAPTGVANAYALQINSDNAAYVYTGTNSISGLVFDSKCVFYFGDKIAYIHAGSGSWITDITFSPKCQFEGGAAVAHAIYIESAGTAATRIENIHVNDNYISTTTTSGITATSTGGLMQALFITQNWMDRQGGPSVNLFCAGTQINGVHIKNNTISNSNSVSAAIFVNGPDNFGIAGNLQVRNVGAPGVVGATYPGYMISVQAGSVDFQITNNTNGGFGGGGVLQDLSGAVVKTVAGNI